MRKYNYLIIVFIFLQVCCDQQQGPQPERWWRRLNQKSPVIYAMVAPRHQQQFQQTEDDDYYSKNTATDVLLKSERRTDDENPAYISSSLRNQITQKICPQSLESTRTVTEYMGDRRPTLMEETHRFNVLYEYMEERITNLTLLYHSERTQNMDLTQEVEKFQESNTELIVYMDMLEREIVYLNQKIKDQEEKIKNQNNNNKFNIPVNGHINGIPISIQNGIMNTLQNKFPNIVHHSRPLASNTGIYMENTKHTTGVQNIVPHSGLSPDLQNDGEIKFQNGQIIKFQNGQIVTHSGVPSNLQPNFNLNTGEKNKYQSNIQYNEESSETSPNTDDNSNYEIHSHLDLSNYNFNMLQNYDNINFNLPLHHEEEDADNVETSTTIRPISTTQNKPSLSSISIPFLPTVPPIPEISPETVTEINETSSSGYAATNIGGMSLYCSEFRSFKVCSDNEALLESVMALLIYADQRVEQ